MARVTGSNPTQLFFCAGLWKAPNTQCWSHVGVGKIIFVHVFSTVEMLLWSLKSKPPSLWKMAANEILEEKKLFRCRYIIWGGVKVLDYPVVSIYLFWNTSPEYTTVQNPISQNIPNYLLRGIWTSEHDWNGASVYCSGHPLITADAQCRACIASYYSNVHFSLSHAMYRLCATWHLCFFLFSFSALKCLRLDFHSCSFWDDRRWSSWGDMLLEVTMADAIRPAAVDTPCEVTSQQDELERWDVK